MEISNELNVGSREQLRAWLSENHDSCDEVWIVCLPFRSGAHLRVTLFGRCL